MRLADLVADVRIGVEVASSPLATLNDLGPGAVISDFGNNWGVVVGAVVPDWRTRVGRARCRDFHRWRIGGAWLNRDSAHPAKRSGVRTKQGAHARGRPLRAGEYISTGMITGVHDIRIGQTSRLVFGSTAKCSAAWCAQAAMPT